MASSAWPVSTRLIDVGVVETEGADPYFAGTRVVKPLHAQNATPVGKAAESPVLEFLDNVGEIFKEVVEGAVGVKDVAVYGLLGL